MEWHEAKLTPVIVLVAAAALVAGLGQEAVGFGASFDASRFHTIGASWDEIIGDGLDEVGEQMRQGLSALDQGEQGVWNGDAASCFKAVSQLSKSANELARS